MITPADIENRVFKKVKIGGYDIKDVEEFLEELIVDYESIFKKVTELNDKCDNIIKMQAQNYNAALQNGQSLESIRENSSIAAYNAEVMRQQYEIRNIMFLH